MTDADLSSGDGQHARARNDAGRGRTGLLPAAPRSPAPLAAFGAAIDWSVVVIGTVMIALVFINVLLHVVSKDFAWVTELAELLMVWVTFLGGASAARRGAQMTITEFIDNLEGSTRRAADAAVDLFATAVLAALVWYGINLAIAGWGNELTVLHLPMSIQYLGMPVGCAAMLVWVLWDLYRIARGDSRAARWGA